MIEHFLKQLFLSIGMLLLLSGCVSKKKHLETINNLTATHLQEMTIRNAELVSSRRYADSLKYQLAEKQGANNAMLLMNDRLQGKIDLLEEELEKAGNSVVDQQASMNLIVQEKEAQISKRDQKLEGVKQIITGGNAEIQQINQALELAFASLAIEGELYSMAQKGAQLSIVLTEELLFRKESVSQLKTKGISVLEQIATVLRNYPTTFVSIIGHTDNVKPQNRGYKDNWNFSVLRAATVARTLTSEFDLGTNQVIASGKGEFSPKSSNSTKEGRAQNERIELLIGREVESLQRSILQQLNKED